MPSGRQTSFRNEDAGTVARERIGTDGAAMRQVLQDLEPVLDNGVARPALEVGDEADTTSVMLASGIEQSLRRRSAERRTNAILGSSSLLCHGNDSGSWPWKERSILPTGLA
jgi:hypothetical protein